MPIQGLFFLLFVVFFVQTAVGQENVCSNNERQFGSDERRSSSSIVQDEYLYLNTRDLSGCWGTIDQFDYCYYRPTGHYSSSHVYKTNFGVYRFNGTMYNRVSDVLTIERTQGQIDSALDWDDDEYDNGNDCRSIDLAEPLTVVPGDVLGVCIFEPTESDIHQLDMVRSNNNNNDVLLRTDTTGCNSSSIPLSVAPTIEVTRRILHLYATIDPLPATEPPTTPEPTTAAPTTEAPTTEAPTTEAPTTEAPTTEAPTTEAATTEAPTTEAPTTEAASTEVPTTEAPTTEAATTEALTTEAPTTDAPTTEAASTEAPTTNAPTTVATTIETPTTEIPTNKASTTEATTTEAPTTQTLTTDPLTTQVPTTDGTEAPTTGASTTRITMAATVETQNTEAVRPYTVLPITDDAPPTQSADTTQSASTGSTTVAGGVDTASQNDNSNNLIAIIVPVVLVILIVGALFGLVIIIAIKRVQKKGQFRTQNQASFDNILYTNGNVNIARTDVTIFHGDYDEVKPPLDFPDYEFIDDYEELGEASGAVYVEIGPSNEDDYESPLDAQVIRFSDLLEKNKERDIYDHISPYEVPALKEKQLYGQLKSWGTRKIHYHEINIVKSIGSGEFGVIEEGIWRRPGKNPLHVLLKSLSKVSEENKVKFLQEAATMAQFRHSNITTLYGLVIQGQPMMMVTELAVQGSLRDYLNSLKPISRGPVSSNVPKLLLKFSQQVALGMQYLSAKGFIHRDLGTRNVVVTQENICKIAEFSMSRNLADEQYYLSQGGRIPVKWTAPEAIHFKKYSTSSDVWSYGCLLYEIWSLGHKPFEGIQNIDVIQMVDAGKRLPPPPGCPKMIYELMTLCWHPQTMMRPSFREVMLTLVDSEGKVLSIPEEDSSTHPLAGVLGAHLEAGENMYQGLQRRYLDHLHAAELETDTDYFDVF